MTTKLFLIHTVPALAEHFRELAAEHLPGVSVDDIVVGELLRRTIEEGRVSQRTIDGLANLVGERGRDADLVMVTCSSLGPAVDRLAGRDDRPVVRVDEAMAREAIMRGDHVGVLATLATTLEPTVDLLERAARDAGRDITVSAHLCEGAFEAISNGDVEHHDDLVRAGLDALLPEVDVVVLAQASMARVVDTLPAPLETPVLSSPELAMRDLARSLAV